MPAMYRVVSAVLLLVVAVPGWIAQAAQASAQSAAGPGALFDRAVAEQGAGDRAAAIRDYKRFLALEPRSVEGHVNLGAALAASGQFDEAVAEYRVALRWLPAKAPEAGEIKLNLALAFYKKGDLLHARAELEPLHAAAPEDARVATLLGEAETQLGDARAALAVMTPLGPANANNPDFLFAYGSALVAAGHRREGAELLERVAKAGGNAQAYMLAGSTLLDLLLVEQARADLEEALKLDPKLAGLHTLVGVARDETRDKDGAMEALREGLEENPEDFTANLYLGALLVKDRELDRAAPLLAKALRLQPESNMAVYENALLKSAGGDVPEAVAGLEKVEAADPDWLEPHVQLSTLYYRNHEPDKGASERATVERLTAAQQATGPGRPQTP